jgi:hypothetical protein
LALVRLSDELSHLQPALDNFLERGHAPTGRDQRFTRLGELALRSPHIHAQELSGTQLVAARARATVTGQNIGHQVPRIYALAGDPVRWGEPENDNDTDEVPEADG